MATLSMQSRVLLAFVVFSLSCTPIAAQKQVTIDRARLAQDRSKKETVRKKQVIQQAPERRQKPRSPKTVENKQPRLATYLRVDGVYSSEVTKKIGNSPKYETFNVTTDGNNWNVSFLPVWCKLSNRTNNSFTLYINENVNYEQRKDWLLVKSDTQEVRLYIEQAAKPINFSATINNAWIEHNTVINGTEYMMVSGSFNIINGNGLKFYALAMILDEYGSYLFTSTSYPEYKLNDGKFFAIAETQNTGGNNNTHTFRIFIPNNSFFTGYGKKRKLKLTVSLFCEKKGDVVSGVSRTIPFIAQKNKKGLRTKAL